MASNQNLTTGGTFRNRVKGLRFVKAADLTQNPKNWRKHSDFQRQSLASMVDEIGFADALIARETSDGLVLIDGHLRSKLDPEAKVPVLIVDLDEKESDKLLATLDPLASMADVDIPALDELLKDIDTESEEVKLLMSEVAERSGVSLGKVDSHAQEEKHSNLFEQFIIPPFSVFDARQGYWQTRKGAWISLGIKSELGRSGAEAANKKNNGGLLMKSWTSHPGFYDEKIKTEKQLGHEISTAEFIEKYFQPPESGACASGTSIFDPVLCELIYRWFVPSNGRILDPFAGGSVRGIIASQLCLRYVGIDLSKQQIEANREQAKEICKSFAPNWIIGDSLNVGKLCKGMTFDLVMSCPPYADLEVYSDDKADISNMKYEDFRKAYFKIISESCKLLKDNRFACFVVGEVRDKKGIYRNLISDTITGFTNCGLKYYNEGVLVTTAGSLPVRIGRQFKAGRKLGKTHQNVLVFVKGDPKKATTACGEINIDMSMFEEQANEKIH